MKLFLFNPFSNLFLNATNNSSFHFNKRVVGMATELIYTTSIFLPIWIFLIIGEHLVRNSPIANAINDVFWGIIIITLLNKDFYNGQSVVKRKFGFQVIDLRTNQAASGLKCMIRNITTLIWPLEAIFCLINPQRRLGDYIVGTIVKEVEPANPENILFDIKDKEYNFSIVFLIFLSVLTASVITIINNII